jgi:hypothetical protein
MTAPNASGRSDLAGRVSHPLEKRRLSTAHAKSGRWHLPVSNFENAKSSLSNNYPIYSIHSFIYLF